MRTIQVRCLHATSLFIAILAAAHATSALAAPGPTSTLYITNYAEFSSGTETGLDLIQGLSVSSFPTGYPVDLNIAVYGDVRTMGYGSPDQGGQFDLAGSPLGGGPYTNTIANSQLHDGTSDGNCNYSVDYTTGDVIEFDRNWASPVVLFNAGGVLPDAGWITMDVADGSFWISEWGGPDGVAHFTHTGALLSTFNTGLVGAAGLALDPIDGTLWTSTYPGTLHQFSQAGTLLQSQNYSMLTQWYGMEFDTTPIPEPGALALMAVGLAGLIAGRRWRRR